MPGQHALLSASSAARWLKCTAAPHYEEQFPEQTSEYAEEGTLAHSICELKVLNYFTTAIKPKSYTTRLNKLKKDPLYQDEMDKTSEIYLDRLKERAMSYATTPYVVAEVRVDFSDYVPEGFGTCDCVMIGGDTLEITDYKHGKGVPVSAGNNPQMRLYALGALKQYQMIYGDTIQRIRMTIIQPRIREEPSTEEITVSELLLWGESIKPIAEKAFTGPGEFCPGEHCRFCRGKARCRARANQNIALEEFKDCVPGDTLSDEEIGALLIRGQQLVKWYEDMEKYALSTILKGGQIPGWKCVAGTSQRKFTDQDAALDAAIAAGYDEAIIYERTPKTLAQLEKLMGKAEFSEKLGAFVIKPQGKPILVPISDKREPYNTASTDFAGITEKGVTNS